MNSTPAFTRFCSASLVGPEQGFDRWIYFANEETATQPSFDGKGALSVAIFESNGVGEADALPALGRFAWENTLVQRNTGDLTVIMGMEDGPSSQIPANVKQPALHVRRSEGQEPGSLGSPAQRPRRRNPLRLPLEEQEQKQRVRVSERHTLGGVGRPPGRRRHERRRALYSLELNPSDPTKDATLSVVYNADAIIAAGGDIAISPDNIDTSTEYLMINEDGTSASRPVMGTKGRDGSIWRFELKPSGGIDASSALRVAELDPPGRNGSPPDGVVGPGIWETSGIIDTASIFGPDTWLSDVQAHSPTPAPGGSTVTVEDGQLFLLRPTT